LVFWPIAGSMDSLKIKPLWITGLLNLSARSMGLKRII
jgi:hypothetical protein